MYVNAEGMGGWWVWIWGFAAYGRTQNLSSTISTLDNILAQHSE